MVPKGWTYSTLEGLIDIKHGFAFKSEYFTNQGQFVLLTPGHFNESGGFRDQQEKTKYYNGVIPDGYLLTKGDLLLAMTEQAAGLLGSAAHIPEDNKYLHNQRLGLVKVLSPKKIDLRFLFWLYNSPEVRKQISEQASGTKVKHTSPGKLIGISALIPPIAEQTKIAQILSSWDKAIATTERLLANSQQQKDMLTNQLLTGQQRFSEFVTSKGYQRTFHGPIPSDWNYVPIADIANQQSKANSTQADLPVLSCSKYDGLVDSLKYFKKKVYSDDTSKYRVVEFGDFAYPSNHIEEGSIGYQDVYPAGIVSPIYTVFRTTDAVDDYFLYRTLKTDKYRQIFSAATSASVDRRGSLRWKEFSKIQVPLPSLAEQQKIAQVLSTADAEISNLQAQLAKLKLEKKALMQQLLTGQRRVKLDADAAA